MYFRLRAIFLVIIILISGSFFVSKSLAGSPNDIIVTMTPPNPTPGQTVNISLNSYLYNLDSVLITYLVNNKKVTEGVGKKSFSLQAPDLSGESTVLVNINLPDGNIQLRLVVKSSNMVMLWQANDSYVPPFYKGKAMPIPDSSIKVVAMPEMLSGKTMLDPNNMTYNWKLDYSNDGESSGYAKNYFIYNNDYLEKVNNVSVDVSTTDQNYSLGGEINISTTKPKIVFYKRDKDLGTMFDNAIPENYVVKQSETLEVAPYFMSPNNPLNPLLTWTWSINDAPVYLNSLFPNILPLQKTEGVSGNAKINLVIENKYRVFQTTKKELNVSF